MKRFSCFEGYYIIACNLIKTARIGFYTCHLQVEEEIELFLLTSPGKLDKMLVS